MVFGILSKTAPLAQTRTQKQTESSAKNPQTSAGPRVSYTNDFSRNDEEQSNQRMPEPRQRLFRGWLNLGPTLGWGFGSRVEDSCSSQECEGVPRLSILGHWNLIPFWHRMASEPKKCHKVSKSRGIRQGLMSLRLSKYVFFCKSCS